MAPKVEILSRDDEHVVALVGNVLLQLWLKAVPFEAARRVEAAGRKLALVGNPFLTLIVVAEEAKPPQGPARQILTAFAQRFSPPLSAGIQVVEANGLKGAVMRSIMTGMAMLVPSVAVLIVKTVEDGLAAASAHGMSVPADEMLAVIKELRAAPTTSTSAPGAGTAPRSKP